MKEPSCCVLKHVVIYTFQGVHFIHNSPLRLHGSITSENCMLNNRWVLKVANFGLRDLRELSRQKQDVEEYEMYRGNSYIHSYDFLSLRITVIEL